MDNQLKNLHQSHGCFIRADKIKDANCCSVFFPQYIINRPLIRAKTYFYNVKPEGLEIFSDLNKDGTVLECPQYSCRIIMLMDIIVKCLKLKLNTDLIICFDGDGNEIGGTERILGLLSEPEDRKSEAALSTMVYDILLGESNSETAVQLNVLEGYRCMKNIFDVGGIL